MRPLLTAAGLLGLVLSAALVAGVFLVFLETRALSAANASPSVAHVERGLLHDSYYLIAAVQQAERTILFGLVHVVAMLACVLLASRSAAAAGWAFCAGVVFGPLAQLVRIVLPWMAHGDAPMRYIDYVEGEARPDGPIITLLNWLAPAAALCIIVGWALLAFAGARRIKPPSS